MYYWQPEPKKMLAEINYSDKMHLDFERQLKDKIQRILEYDYSNFDKTLYKKAVHTVNLIGFVIMKKLIIRRWKSMKTFR